LLQAELEVKQEVKPWLINMRDELFKSWSDDLNEEEKEIWLWNAFVELKRIQQRRKI
jgi:hypothetical protein